MLYEVRVKPQAQQEALLATLLGEAPRYQAGSEEPGAYLRRLLEWGALKAPASAGQGQWVSCDTYGQYRVNLQAVHAADCFPHAWKVPLMAVAVREANEAVAPEAAAAPDKVLSAALRKHRPLR